MQIIWRVLQTFYAVFLLPVVALFIFALFSELGHDRQALYMREASYMLIAFGLAYFVLGYVMFKTVPDLFKAKLMKRVARFKTNGFKPKFEALSVLFNRYLGFDPDARKLLFVDVNDHTEQLLDFDNINSWEVEGRKNNPTDLRLLTAVPSLPVININIDRHKTDEWKAYLRMIFGW
ncbi:MAG: hypothetical protein V4563_03575 [Pseudomonadota bacterium]